MPELPEVEIVVRGLRRHLTGKRIASVELLWPGLIVGDPARTARTLEGQKILGLRRHGKYILFDLEKQGRASLLVAHLRMTGNFLINGAPGRFTRAILHLEGGPSVAYHDMRRFGRWQWSRDLPPRLRELGPEPLEIGEEDFVRRLRSRNAMAKALLMDQEFLRGLGNIYADEALFRARIHPRAKTSRIGPARARRLWQAIRDVLEEAIAQGGSTVINYVNSDGAEGYFQLSTFVYGKAGQPCKVCGTPVRRIVVGSRGTHYCPRCQRG